MKPSFLPAFFLLLFFLFSLCVNCPFFSTPDIAPVVVPVNQARPVRNRLSGSVTTLLSERSVTLLSRRHSAAPPLIGLHWSSPPPFTPQLGFFCSPRLFSLLLPLQKLLQNQYILSRPTTSSFSRVCPTTILDVNEPFH